MLVYLAKRLCGLVIVLAVMSFTIFCLQATTLRAGCWRTAAFELPN